MPNSSTLSLALGNVEVGPLILEPIQQVSLALSLTTTVFTREAEYSFPKITQDPQAEWLGENDEIPLSESAGDNVVVRPRKIGGLAVISNELANDTSPEAHGIIARGLANDMAGKIDAAWFGAIPTNPNQPEGIEGNYTSVVVANPSDGLDPFISAQSAARERGVKLSAWVVTPQIAADLAHLRVGVGSNLPLFGTGATNGISQEVLGLPLLVSSHVLPGTAWGIPSEGIYSVIRQNIEIQIDKSRYMEFDQTAIRAIMRIGFGFPSQTNLVKIKAA